RFLFVCLLVSLAGPAPSGSPGTSRLCQRCLPPSPAPPGSGCAQLPPGCCDSPARRPSTSFDSQRLTAHQRLVAHKEIAAELDVERAEIGVEAIEIPVAGPRRPVAKPRIAPA